MIQLAAIIILGIFAQWIAWRTKVPAILPLIIIGLLVGPLSTFFTDSGEKLLEPMYDGHDGLFPGESLFWFVSLAIGLILFEGGLTLRKSEVKGVGPAILKLITLGSFITFIGSAVAAHLLLALSWPISFLFGALVIVTGPTVIAPILRNLPLNRNVTTVLKWEGILIDPIGALGAVLVFEFIVSGVGTQGLTLHVLQQFGLILVEGVLIGGAFAYLLYFLLIKNLIPNFLLNVFTLALVLLVFVLSDRIVHESGLLSVVIMGMVLGNMDEPRVKDILHFKESISVLLISILFILLAANIDMRHLELLMDWRCLALFLIVLVILRPLAVFSSTTHSGLTLPEKTFISLVGPRGIVAAGIASLFGIKLTAEGTPGAEYITPLVFMVVLGTVIFVAATGRMFAGSLGVLQKDSNGILIIGANQAAQFIAKYLQDNGRKVILIDKNNSNVYRAKELGLNAIQADIYNEDLSESIELLDMGYLMALTASSEVNRFACFQYKDDFGENGTFRLISPEELASGTYYLESEGLFSYTDDYINISEVVRDNPEIHEVKVDNKESFIEKLKILYGKKTSIPLFVREGDDNLVIIPAEYNQLEVTAGSSLVYLGEKVDF
jgi:NhaP-type Na+/H+ or K+/H+ antiporter